MSCAPWADVIFSELLAEVREWDDPGENPRILEYFRVGCPGYKPAQGDETDWCAALMWFALVEAGCVVPEKRKPVARDLLRLEEKVLVPRNGDVAILWRDSKTSWQGHVGILVGQTATYFYLLGGNQGDRVSVSAFATHRILGFRRPRIEEG